MDYRKKGGDNTLKKHGKKHFKRVGKKGGKTTLTNYGRNHFQKIGAKGLEKRWGKKEK